MNRHLALSILLLLHCAPELHPVEPEVTCRTSLPPDMARSSECIPCAVTYCHGPELPLCSSCGDRACLARGARMCCDDAPTPDPLGDLPLCRLGVRGGPAISGG